MLFVCRMCVECKFHQAFIQECRDCLKSKTMFVKSYYMSKPFMIRKFIFKRVIPLWKFLHTSSAGFDAFTSALWMQSYFCLIIRLIIHHNIVCGLWQVKETDNLHFIHETHFLLNSLCCVKLPCKLVQNQTNPHLSVHTLFSFQMLMANTV